MVRSWSKGWSGALGVVGALLAVWPAAAAHAHPDVERARSLALEADVEGARAALDRTTHMHLTEPERIRSLEARALIALIEGDDAGRDDALRELASLDANHRMGRELPPRLVEAWERVRATLPAVNEPAAPAPTPASAISPDLSPASVAASAATPDVHSPHPNGHRRDAAATPRVHVTRPPIAEGETGVPAWPFILGGAVLAAAVAAVVAAVLVPGSETQLGAPTHGLR